MRNVSCPFPAFPCPAHVQPAVAPMAAGVPLLLGMTLPLLGALCLLGRLLAARLVRNIKRT